jgi:hypothetical protein
MWNFEASDEVRKEMLKVGFDAANHYLQEFKSEKPLRRYSVG